MSKAFTFALFALTIAAAVPCPSWQTLNGELESDLDDTNLLTCDRKPKFDMKILREINALLQ
jgi:hypothetical protein